MMFFIWLIAGFLLIALGMFIFTQGGQNLGPLIATIGVMILLVLLMSPSRAHDHNNPDRDDWLRSLHAKNKTWCCDGNDTDTIEDWQTKGNSYRVKTNGQWFDVPEDAVVDGPNKGGEALLWMSKGYLPSVRCFMPGLMG